MILHALAPPIEDQKDGTFVSLAASKRLPEALSQPVACQQRIEIRPVVGCLNIRVFMD